MSILGYQVTIAISIFISAFFGRNTRNTVVFSWCFFTVIMVFTSWLIIFQLITIGISYLVSNSNSHLSDERESEIPRQSNEMIHSKNKSGSSIYYILFIIITSISYGIYLNLAKPKPATMLKTEEKTLPQHIDSSIQYSAKNFHESTSDETTIDDNVDSSEINFYKNNLNDKTDEQYEESLDQHKETLYGKYSNVIYSETNINMGDIQITPIDKHHFNFKLYVENNTDTGQIQGIATLISPDFAKYTSDDCENINFIFSKNKVNILESNCYLHHGNKVNFNVTFEK